MFMEDLEKKHHAELMTEARQDAGWGTFDGYEASGLCVQKSWL